MRRFVSYLLFMLISLNALPSVAKDNKVVTAHFTVDGVCDQCKTRIENAAYIKGVKFAEWSEVSHDLTVKYDTTKTSSDDILKHIAKAGHDAGQFKALDEDYKKVPKCCRYRDGAKMHSK